jgi:hypothetical protein
LTAASACTDDQSTGDSCRSCRHRCGKIDPVRELIVAAEAVLGIHQPFDPSSTQRTFTVMTSDYVTMVLLKPLLAELAARI